MPTHRDTAAVSVLPQVPKSPSDLGERVADVLGCYIQGEVLLENALLCRMRVFTVSVAKRQKLPVSPAPKSLLQTASCSCLLLSSQQPVSQCVASNAIYNKGQNWKLST